MITARGGSKRIPGKNIKEFCGKPILAYSIEAALKSGVFDEVMVSTDDDRIAEIAIGDQKRRRETMRRRTKSSRRFWKPMQSWEILRSASAASIRRPRFLRRSV